MRLQITRSLCLAFICAVSAIGSAFTFFSLPTPISRSGLSNVGAKQIDSCLVVYGVSKSDNSISVEMYDPQLRLMHSFSEKISGFTVKSLTLSYASDTRIEFIINDQKDQKQKYIFLDHELKSLYESESSLKPVALNGANSKTLDTYRIDDYYWEIRTETQDVVTSRKITTTALCQYAIKRTPTGPANELNRIIVLDSFAVEYAKVFLVRDNRIYVYVNESSSSGQFVYCISGFDGSLIYKTRLSVKYPDRNGINVAKAADACYYSNFYYNERSQRLILSGAWTAETRNCNGIFVLQLDENGKVTGSLADYGAWLEIKGIYNSASGFAGNSAALQTVQRVVSIEQQTDGTFVVISELYGQRIRNWTGHEKSMTMDDDNHHYFCMYAQMFTVTSNEIKPLYMLKYTTVAEWKSNHHLDSVQGFVSGQTKLYDRMFTGDFNLLSESENPLHYRASFLNVNKTGVKILSYDSVIVSSTQNSHAYFSKFMYPKNNLNCLAMVEPNPIHNQKFSEPADYFAIDAKRLYKFNKTANGFNLGIQEW